MAAATAATMAALTASPPPKAADAAVVSETAVTVAAAAAKLAATQAAPTASSCPGEVWLPPALQGDPLGLWGPVHLWADEICALLDAPTGAGGANSCSLGPTGAPVALTAAVAAAEAATTAAAAPKIQVVQGVVGDASLSAPAQEELPIIGCPGSRAPRCALC